MFSSFRQKLKEFINRTEKSVDNEIKVSTETKIKGILTGKVKLSEKDIEDTLWKFQLDLIQSDVAVETTEYIIEKLREKLLGREIERNEIHKFIINSLRHVLKEALTPEGEIDLIELIKNSDKPYKIVFFGVNGSGKTTTIAKVANLFMKNNLKSVFAAGDTFRAGAIEQLKKHGENLGIKTISHQKGADSAAVIYDAIEHARAKEIDVVLADTAGRMQTNINLMDEMKKICRVNRPDLRIFVGDALTGNDAVEQAKRFNEEVGIDAVILTKMDANEKGGSAISITNETKKPIIFVGVGQGYDDLKEFDREWFLDRILDL